MMARPLLQERTRAPRRDWFSLFALFSVVILGLLAISVLSSNQAPAAFEEVDGVDFDNVEEVKTFLTSKIRASAGDEYL